jgi:acyl-CoA hydrolase
MDGFDWKNKYPDLLGTASGAIKQIRSGDNVFIGTGCAQPQHIGIALSHVSARR